MKRPKHSRTDEVSREPFHNPFSGLKELRDQLPAASTPAPAPAESRKLPRAVIRLERKGRGGKEVTVVEQLELGTDELERWLKEMKQSLGCGGTLENGALVFQGDQRPRVKAALLARGIRRVSGS